jgi:hypothetical protein
MSKKRGFDDMSAVNAVNAVNEANATLQCRVEKKRKTYIPKSLRMAVWKQHIGIEKGTSMCTVCNSNTMCQLDFQCGHIQSEADGGPTCLSNLMPVCSKCNTSMGKKNLHDFKGKYFT